MARRTRVRDYDQFIVRLPPGMRDRIKAKADRAGMSMNEAIIWCLDAYFPAPATLEQKLDELVQLAAALKRGSDVEPKVDELVKSIDRALRDIADGKIKVSKSFAEKVHDQIMEWDIAATEDAQDPFDDANYGVSQVWIPDADDDPFGGGGKKGS